MSPWLAEALARGEALTPQLVAAAAAHNDPGSVDLLRQTGALVGTMLASIVSLLNPSLVVVVGGSIGGAGDFFLATIREVVYGQALPLATRDLRIVEAELGPAAGVIGAAAMALDQLFCNENLRDTVARLTRDRAWSPV
jgi:predicted NBD/HSP70 family sugar kinase